MSFDLRLNASTLYDHYGVLYLFKTRYSVVFFLLRTHFQNDNFLQQRYTYSYFNDEVLKKKSMIRWQKFCFTYSVVGISRSFIVYLSSGYNEGARLQPLTARLAAIFPLLPMPISRPTNYAESSSSLQSSHLAT